MWRGYLQVLMFALASGLLAIAAPDTAVAEEEGAVRQIALDAKTVERTIAASREVYEVREQAGEETGSTADGAGDPAVGDELSAGEIAEIEAIAKAHGFKDVVEFDKASASVMTALMHIELEDKAVVAEIKEEIGRLEADTTLAADAREEMLAALRRQLTPPPLEFPGNIDAVRPFTEELRALLEGGEPIEGDEGSAE